MDSLLPYDHLMNKKWIRIAFYGITYPLLGTVAVPTVYILSAWQDMTAAKLLLFEQFHIVHPDILSVEIFCIYISTDQPVSLFALFVIIFLSTYALFIMAYSWITVNKILKENFSHISRTANKQHKEVMTALGSMALSFGSIVTITVGTITFLIVTASWRADLCNYAIVYLGIGCPLTVSAFIVTYRPYRRVIFSGMKRVLPLSQPVSSIAFVFTLG